MLWTTVVVLSMPVLRRRKPVVYDARSAWRKLA
jgi:hypothetical protein